MKTYSFVRGREHALKTLLILLLGLSLQWANAQQSILDRELSISINNKDLEGALAQIENVTGYSFSYAPDAINNVITINKRYSNTTLREILNEILVEYEIYYRASGTTIQIQTDARKGGVTGKAFASNGTTLPFVSVRLKSTSFGAATDKEGNFSFYAPEGEYIIVASSMGFASIEKMVTVTADATVQINFALQEDSSQLNEVVVQGTREYLYREEATSVFGTRMPLAEVPATVNVITSDFLEDTRAYDVEDAVTYVPGVITGGFGGGTNATYLIRGFSNSASFFNGLRQFRLVQQTPSLDNIARVEIVKGPSGADFGLADAGGVLNFVTFKPQKEFAARAFAGFGDFGFRRVGGDVTGSIDKKKNLTYRFIGSYAERAEWRPGRPNRTPRLTIAPSLAWDYAKGGNLLVEYQYTYTDEPLDRGVLYMEGAGFEDNFAPRDWSGSQKASTMPINSSRIDVKLSQSLSKVFGLELAYQRLDETRNNELQYMWADARPAYREDGLTFNGDSTIGYIAPRDEDGESDIDNISVTGLANFDTGILKNTVRFGYQYSDARFLVDFLGNGGPGRRNIENTIDIFNPDNNQEFVFTERNNNGFFQDRQEFSSFFGQWSTSIGTRARIIAGARYDDVEQFVRFDAIEEEGTPSINSSKEISFRVSCSFDLLKNVSVFAGYSDSHTPQGGITANGEQIKALHNKGAEIGLKTALFNERLLWTNTFYRTTQDNIAAPDPNDETDMFSIPFGEVRIQGFESEFIGSVSDKFDISAGVTLQESENIRVDDETLQGNEFFGVPNFQFSAFGTYNLEDILPNFQVRLGILSVGERQGNALNNFQLPSFTRFDFGISYVLNKKTTLDLFAQNLFDTTYFEQTQGRAVPSLGIIPGDRRLIQFNVTHRF